MFQILTHNFLFDYSNSFYVLSHLLHFLRSQLSGPKETWNESHSVSVALPAPLTPPAILNLCSPGAGLPFPFPASDPL